MCILFLIAPHAGARIETTDFDFTNNIDIIAPHAGARIETGFGVMWCPKWSSPPTRGRGLKL